MILLRPEWLLALPLLAVAGWLLHRQRGGLGGWDRVADPRLLQAMTALGRVERRGSAVGLLAVLACAGVTVLALTGPAVERRDALSFRNLDGAVFVLDASPSMTGGAGWQAMQVAARYGVASLGTRPGGLVVFAGDAYVASDLTADLRQLGQTLSLIDADTVPDPGTRPERGLALALRMLDEAEVLAGDVIFLTDGAGLEEATLKQAAAIAGRGARLTLVTPGPPPPEALTHAEVGRGQALAATDPEALARWLGDEARQDLVQQDFPLLFSRDLGRWLLVLAMVPLLLLFRRGTP